MFFVLQLTVMEDLSLSSIDVGQPGKANDAMVFKMSPLWAPSGGRVDHLIAKKEYHLLGDGAYPTKSYLLKPYRYDGQLTRAQQKYNFVHASIRSMVEQGIGQLKGRFRYLQFLDARTPSKAKKIIAMCCFLHNFALKNCDITDEEFTNDNDGRESLSQEEIDAMFGADDTGVDKRQAIMRTLSSMSE